MLMFALQKKIGRGTIIKSVFECKTIFAAARFRKSSAQFFKNLRGILTLVSSAIALSTYNSSSHSLLETVLRECLTFLFFHRSCCSER